MLVGSPPLSAPYTYRQYRPTSTVNVISFGNTRSTLLPCFLFVLHVLAICVATQYVGVVTSTMGHSRKELWLMDCEITPLARYYFLFCTTWGGGCVTCGSQTSFSMGRRQQLDVSWMNASTDPFCPIIILLLPRKLQ